MQPELGKVRLKLHVKTMSRETRLVCEPDKTLTLHVTAPPTKGKANREIVKWLAKKLDVSSSEVRIVVGLYSNSKVVEVNGVTENEAALFLGIDPTALTSA
jgi:uncharacterized protein (TIGR00251 family)